ncbi:hypothetical protein [Aquisphaera insulae]|uniref:hypothetical protein n=1 Tax=Aquisphaera insulae TaxID=2712864 RepID=UPI0013E9CE9E|nr:hypothetical protein [Aquisphaera insulae]
MPRLLTFQKTANRRCALPVRPTSARDPEVIARWRRLAATAFRVLGLALLLAVFLLVPDPLSSRSAPGQAAPSDGDASSSGAGTILESQIVELWLPGSLRGLEDPAVRAKVLESPDGLRGFLDRPGFRDQPPAVTIRCHRADGRPCDFTQILHPLMVPDHLRMLREALDGLDDAPEGVADNDEIAVEKVHSLPDGLLDREQAEILAELDRIRDEEETGASR